MSFFWILNIFVSRSPTPWSAVVMEEAPEEVVAMETVVVRLSATWTAVGNFTERSATALHDAPLLKPTPSSLASPTSNHGSRNKWGRHKWKDGTSNFTLRVIDVNITIIFVNIDQNRSLKFYLSFNLFYLQLDKKSKSLKNKEYYSKEDKLSILLFHSWNL